MIVLPLTSILVIHCVSIYLLYACFIHKTSEQSATTTDKKHKKTNEKKRKGKIDNYFQKIPKLNPDAAFDSVSADKRRYNI